MKSAKCDLNAIPKLRLKEHLNVSSCSQLQEQNAGVDKPSRILHAEDNLKFSVFNHF